MMKMKMTKVTNDEELNTALDEIEALENSPAPETFWPSASP